MTARAQFRCIRGCEKHALDEPVYACGTCGSLLEIVHDDSVLSARDAGGWKSLFESRPSGIPGPHGSGVWRYHEWLLPDLPLEEIVTLGEGGTPLVQAKRLGDSLDLDLTLKVRSRASRVLEVGPDFETYDTVSVGVMAIAPSQVQALFSGEGRKGAQALLSGIQLAGDGPLQNSGDVLHALLHVAAQAEVLHAEPIGPAHWQQVETPDTLRKTQGNLLRQEQLVFTQIHKC